MALDLTNLKIKESFPLLLQCGANAGEGLDSTLRAVADGKGQESKFDLSTAAARLRSAFQLAAQASPTVISAIAQLYANTDGELACRSPSGDYILTPPPWFGRIAGRYYPCFGGAFSSTASLAVDTLTAQPFFLGQTTTLTKIGMEVTAGGGAGSLVRLGLYANANGIPGSLLLDAGTILGDSIAVQEITISKLLAPGWYWMVAIANDGAITFRRVSLVAAAINHLLGNTAPGDGSIASIFAAQAYGALPASFPALTYSTTTNIPAIWTRN